MVLSRTAPRPLRRLRVGVAQLPGAPAPFAERRAAAEVALAAALSSAGAVDLLLLPEATFPGYGPGQRPQEAAEQAARGEGWAVAAAARTGLHIAVGLGMPDRSVLLLVAPDGARWRYTKAYPTFAETAAWRAGPGPMVAHTRLGAIGLAVCADVIQPGLWAGLRGRVSLVLAAGAWGDFHGRLAGMPWWRAAALGPWIRGSAEHRDRTLRAAAAALEVPVAWANACGPFRDGESFSGGSMILGPDGCLRGAVEGAGPGFASAELLLGPPQVGRPPPFPLAWRAFAFSHRLAVGARSAWTSRVPGAAPAGPQGGVARSGDSRPSMPLL
ncbi:carbon-nitrogen hydrolase family protein [Myxococcota bacterium]|nr:carbon-nitrogen hydrolase family protein [Myxococcota bacterium]